MKYDWIWNITLSYDLCSNSAKPISLSIFDWKKKNKTKPNKNYMKSTECFHCDSKQNFWQTGCYTRKAGQTQHDPHTICYPWTGGQRLHGITLLVAVYDEKWVKCEIWFQSTKPDGGDAHGPVLAARSPGPGFESPASRCPSPTRPNGSHPGLGLRVGKSTEAGDSRAGVLTCG